MKPNKSKICKLMSKYTTNFLNIIKMSTQKDYNKVDFSFKENSPFYLGVLRFSLGYIMITCYHLFNYYEYYQDISYTPPFTYILKHSLIDSIPVGIIVGIILVNYKKILDFKIVK